MQLKIKDFEDVMLKALNDNLEYLLPLHGTSMEPFLHSGDLAIIKKEIPKRLDVVLYQRSDGAYVFHRILRVKKGYYLVTGDNQVAFEKVLFTQVKALMIGFYHKGILKKSSNKGYKLKVWLWSWRLIRKVSWFITKRKYIKKQEN